MANFLRGLNFYGAGCTWRGSIMCTGCSVHRIHRSTHNDSPQMGGPVRKQIKWTTYVRMGEIKERLQPAFSWIKKARASVNPNLGGYKKGCWRAARNHIWLPGSQQETGKCNSPCGSFTSHLERVRESGVKYAPKPPRVHKNYTINRWFSILIDMKIAENDFFP